MRVFMFTKKSILLITCCSIGLFLLLLMLFYDFTSSAATSRSPIFQGNSGEKAVAIEVNVDWGEEYIPAMLEEFKKNQAEVTFFVTGVWAEKNQELVKLIAASGHSLQNHGYKHVHFANLSDSDIKEQIKKAEKIIKDITGHETRYFASPYGEQNKKIMSAVDSINYDLIMWSIDTIDWQKPNPETIVKRVVNQLHNDAIILMHPTEPTVKSLPTLLKSINEQGYKMVKIENIIAPVGVAP